MAALRAYLGQVQRQHDAAVAHVLLLMVPSSPLFASHCLQQEGCRDTTTWRVQCIADHKG
jgi:hypothetical protein